MRATRLLAVTREQAVGLSRPKGGVTRLTPGSAALIL